MQDRQDKKTVSKFDTKDSKFESRNKKGRRQRKDSCEVKEKKTSSFKPGNDFSWWSKYPDLIRDSCSIPLNWFPGTKLIPDMDLDSNINPYAPVSTFRIGIQNAYGVEDSSTGPINMMARNLYLAMHRNYRGLNAYQSADLAMVLIATVELFSFIASLERIYGVLNRYNILNRATPYADLEAMGVGTILADDLRLHLADFRYGLNSLILKAQNVLFPKDMSVLADKLSLFGYVYKDHNSEKAQHIVFDLKWVGKYDATYWSGSSVAFSKISLGTSYQTPLTILKGLIDALTEDDDVVRIYSDLCAFLGPEAFVTLQSMPEDYVVDAIYSEEILHKVHNMRSAGVTVEYVGGNETYNPAATYMYYWEHINPNDPTHTPTAPRITQWNNTVITKSNAIYGSTGILFHQGTTPGCETTGYIVPYKNTQYLYGSDVPRGTSILDTYHEDSTPETILEGCLFKNCTEVTMGGSLPNYEHFVRAVALEYITDMNVITSVNGTVTSAPAIFQYVVYDNDLIGSSFSNLKLYNGMIYGALRLSQIDWAPFIYQTKGAIGDGVNEYYYDNDITDGSFTIFGDMDNCRLVDITDIVKVQETACYSAWASAYAFIGK